METIDLGFKKFEITRQAFIVFIALIISFFLQLMVLIFFTEDSGILSYILFIMYIAIIIPLYVYGTNCLVTGKCIVLSWIVAMVYVGLAIVFSIAMILIAIAKDKNVREDLIVTGMRRRPKKSSH